MMPWLHLYIDTSGLVKACCDANITFGNINNQSIEEIWQGEPIRKFRKLMLAGQRDRRCDSCFAKEAAGKASMRMETLDKFAHRMDWVQQTDLDGYSPSSKPIYFDIRFNNLCNLRCRTCWHGASSSWFEEAKVLKNNFGKKAIIEAAKDSGHLIDILLNQGIEVEEIYFAGGEPLMMKEHYELLDRLIENGNTKVHLRYNTNLTLLSLKDRSVLALWSFFDRVTVAASIDEMGEQVEYMRKGIDWKRFIHNMQKIKTELPHVQLEIAPTISVFNVDSLGELHQFFVEQELIDVNALYLNVLSRPDYYNIKVLPKAAKQLAQAKLESHLNWLSARGGSEVLMAEFESVIAYMNQEDWSHKTVDLRQHLAQLDRMRLENFETVFPVLKKALDLA
ncbi:twitch domain-containing radical SAM protein [Reichenbachiella carrageenanivorans]|uniref:Twitch domain-containing radical SAM protein n=1 Tax=Reichenbachiella carrageenanivorans TaxID=2979869 RepID=A0ABY6CWW8_9BACT|nr:twitch domain-containing radical SAM protein [Reichenbachiella carrageenanivorans]UXX78421.1 twitch domain-containing radical SAM protein [Reichenbachiella carrageenanivorans]